MKRVLVVASGIALLLLTLNPQAARAFTQSGFGLGFGNGIPMGHEWVTRLAALELIGYDPVIRPDPNDPRRGWTQGKARNTDLSSPGAQRELARIKSLTQNDQRYQAAFKPVYDAIMGERWVDIAGFNVAKGKIGAKLGSTNCWDDAAQEPVEVQYDHYMRRPDDQGGEGGVNAMRMSQRRFVEYFVAAATAPSMNIIMWDGGGWSEQNEVDLNYFLFGRAVHLFQDSFSSEHTVRVNDDNYVTVRQVRSYLCAPGSEQHTHDQSAIFDYTSGDVVWNPGTQLETGWAGYKPSNMKTTALVATEGSKDLWAAFIRTMGSPREERRAVAQREAQTLVDNWLSGNEGEVRAWYTNFGRRGPTYVKVQSDGGPGQTMATCMIGIGFKSGTQEEALRKFAAGQKRCLFNLEPAPGYEDTFDRSLHMPYNWQWKSISWLTPPPNWPLPDREAITGVPVRIRNVARGQNMTADSIANDSWVWLKPGTPLEFVRVSSPGDSVYRLRWAPRLFLSYTLATGAVKLYDSPADANYSIRGQGIYSLKYNQWMWANGLSPYINRSGDPNKPEGQWTIEQLP